MERYFCLDCGAVVVTDRMTRNDRGDCCPLCESSGVRLWEWEKGISNYYGQPPEAAVYFVDSWRRG
jgi:hypothetical protein